MSATPSVPCGYDLDCLTVRGFDPLSALDLACDIVWRLLKPVEQVRFRQWARAVVRANGETGYALHRR